MIGTIILDLDGPLMDGRQRHYQCYADILLERGYTPLTVDEYWRLKRQRASILEQLAFSGAEGIYDDFLRDWSERIEQKRYLGLDRLQPGVVQELENWGQSGIMTILATMRNCERNLYWQLEAFKLCRLIDRVVVSGSYGGYREKASAVSTCLEEVSRNLVLWIGDTEVDIKAARLLNIKVCALACGLRTWAYLSTLEPDYLVSDLVELNLTQRQSL